MHDNAQKGSKTNIFVPAFTTSYARLKLYEYLDLLQHQVLYFDTYSIIYKWRQGQPIIQIRDFLEDMKNKLEPGDVITEFISGGARIMAIRHVQAK